MISSLRGSFGKLCATDKVDYLVVRAIMRAAIIWTPVDQRFWRVKFTSGGSGLLEGGAGRKSVNPRALSQHASSSKMSTGTMK